MNSTMTPSLIGTLIRKDWYFNKHIIAVFGLLGLFSVYLLTFKSSIFYIGLVLLLSMVILIGALLVFSTVVNEKKNHTLAFMMSLPITCMDYTKAKMIFNLSTYFIAWFILTISTLCVIAFTEHIPNGLMPYALIILIELMVAYVLVLAVALVTESEIWAIVVMTITNIGVSLFMFFIRSFEGIDQHLQGAVAVWNSTAMIIISIEVITAFIIIGLTFYLQSRKKDFI